MATVFRMPQKSDLIPRMGGYTPITKAPNYSAPKKKKTKDTTKTVTSIKTAYDPVFSNYAGGYGSSGGSGGYGSSGGSGGGGYSLASSVMKPDISQLLAAYDAQAESAKKTAQSAYDTTRNDLLTSLKRFQEQNAQDVSNQKQSYLSEQASLEGAREQANRQNRVAAASRGLGGSGLQQLAQLQTLMSQGEEISKAAGTNQKAMDALRQALQQKEDDTNTNLAKAQSTLTDALNSIDSNLAEQKAKAIFEVEQDYANTLNSLLGSGGSGGGRGGYGSGGSGGDEFDPIVEGLLESYNTTMQGLSGKNMKGLYKAVNSAFGTKFKKAKVDTMKNYISKQFINKLGENMSSNMSRNYYNDVMGRAKAMASGLTAKKTTTKKKTSTKKKKK